VATAAARVGRCKVHGGKSTGPRTPEGLERSRRANWKHGHFSREAKAERSRVRAAILALRYLRRRNVACAHVCQRTWATLIDVLGGERELRARGSRELGSFEELGRTGTLVLPVNRHGIHVKLERSPPLPAGRLAALASITKTGCQ
jgi:hypothetical protein